MGPPSKSDGRQNGTNISLFQHKSCFFLGPCFKPCFHETIVMLQQHYDIDRFLDGDWLIFCFRCVSLCSVLYNILITCFQKTLVNAQPLSPPFFAETAAPKQKYVFSHFCVCFCFSIVSYCCRFSGTPCRRPGPDWLHVGSMLVPLLV